MDRREYSTRKTRLAKNAATSLLLRVTTIVCGLILPRLFILSYGSKVNGLINSISQYLNVISLLELGVGAVVQSALYKPLADKDDVAISKIYVSANKFFHHIGQILCGYVAVLVFIYPSLANDQFDRMYTALLILAMSISYFAQYYFGIVNQLLLNADQRGYIQYLAQIITLVINTVACYVLVKLNFSIQIVKLSTSLIYLARPLFLYLYVEKNYNIDKRIKYTGEPIAQKWNGIAQHIASFILGGTDILVLTKFSTLKNVSIYNVYYLVINGMTLLIESITAGFGSLLGELFARDDKDQLKKTFSDAEWLVNFSGTLFFGCTLVLLIPFVKVYTYNIQDANYIRPIFSLTITAAYFMHCLRIPYSNMILAAGHYKQTQSNYIIAAVLNLAISIITVRRYGLVGVAIGTLVAMTYQTIWMAHYTYINILHIKFIGFWRQFIVSIFSMAIGTLMTYWIPMRNVNVFYWIVLAAIDFIIWCVLLFAVNYIFYKDNVMAMMRNLKHKRVK